MLTYSQVEAALAQVHFIDAEAIGAFRGRIKHFQRIGIVPASPGRGKKISYEISDFLVWAYGLELAQFGIDPIMIKEMISKSFSVFLDIFEIVDKREHDLYLVIYPNIMSAYIYGNRSKQDFGIQASVMSMTFIDDADASLNLINNKLMPNVDYYKTRPAPADIYRRRMLILNITNLKRQLEIALEKIDGVPVDVLKNIVFDRRPNNVSP